MKKYSLAAIVGCAIISVVPASANSSTFMFGGSSTAAPISTSGTGFGDSMTFGGGTGGVSGGVANATIYAYSNSTSTTITGTTFQTAQLGQSTGTATVTGTDGNKTIPLGLTDCNQYEGLNCGSPQHQVSNNEGYDFVLIEFSAAVDLSSLTLSTYQGNGSSDSQDFSYVYGTGADPTITPGSTTVASLMGSATQVNCTTAGYNTLALSNCDTGASNTYGSAQGFGGNGATWVMIAAQDPNTGGNDFFKISDLTVTTYNGTQATPEPGTFGLIGLALAGLGIAGRKLKLGKS